MKRSYRTRLVVFVCSVALLLANSLPSVAASFSGRVVDENGQPVKGFIEGIPIYLDQRQHHFTGLNFVIEPETDIENVEIIVRLRMRICGRVLSADGTPLRNTRVHLGVKQRSSVSSLFTCQFSKRLRSFFKIAFSLSPHCHAMSSPVSRQNAFQTQSLFFFFQRVPHLIEFKDDSVRLGFRGMCVLIAEVSYPLREGAGCGVSHFCDSIHREPMTVEKDSGCAFCQGSALMFVVFCPLIVAFFAFIALFFVDVSVFHEVCRLTFSTVHKSLLVK